MNSRRDLCLPTIVLNRKSQDSLQRQIYLQIAEAIRRGAIVNPARLPSTRLLAKTLGISRNTVMAAYEDLASDELIVAHRGAGMRVNRVARPTGIFGVQQAVRESHYPARIISLTDPDGNALYINY